ncbi:MAG: alpha/beta hydrolase [Acidobacteria bacterium]|nr:alpha/beta hydrolase [Acidobacteriota bacterium]MCA1620651.1 alpha/beta hydrolase [Acidobacteriota bacterium]
MPDADITLAERFQGLAGRSLGLLPEAVQLRLSGRPPVELDGQRLDPCLQLLLAVNRRRKRHGLCEPDPATARARFRREVLIYGGPKTRVGPVRDFEIEGEAGPVRVRHYAPLTDSRDLLVYLHGGGFVLGDLETHDEPCRLLCRHAPTHVLAVEYRLAPEHPFPAGLGDALAALRWAQANAERLGAEPARVSVGGDSAGGNLAAVVARLSARERPPAAQLLVYPATDATERERRPSKELFGRGFFIARTDCDAFSEHYTGGEGKEDPRVSPLLAPDLSGLAPALVVTAGFDYLRDEGDAYALALAEAGGVVVPRRFSSLAHGFIHMTGVCPAARATLVETARDWRALLERVAVARGPAREEVLHEEAAP